MEILIGLLCSIFVYIYIYKEALEKEKLLIELKKYIVKMDQDLKKIIIDSMSNFEKRITKLEIEIAKIKVKAGIYAAVFSGCMIVIIRIGEYMIFGT